MTAKTRPHAISGDPVGHVRTPISFVAERGIDAACVALQVGRPDPAAGWRGLEALQNRDGFIITAPHPARSSPRSSRCRAATRSARLSRSRTPAPLRST